MIIFFINCYLLTNGYMGTYGDKEVYESFGWFVGAIMAWILAGKFINPKL